MKLGVMGGTFDPIHLGHLRAAELARQALGLDQVAFLPSLAPPHRRGTLASARDRWTMVCLATASHPSFVPSDLELEREGPSYTVDTLEALARQRPDALLLLIVGSDAYSEMASWRDPQGILARAELAVVPRPGTPAPDASAPFAGRARVHVVAGAALDVSATAVRALAAAGGSLRYLVPEPVADYIAKRGLYR